MTYGIKPKTELKLKIPTAIKEYLDEVKPLVEMAYNNKDCYDLGMYYKEIKDKLLEYYGVESMGRLWSFMSYLVKHSGASIDNYIKSTEYCHSFKAEYSKEKFNSIAPGLFLKLCIGTIPIEVKKLIIEGETKLNRENLHCVPEPEPIIANPNNDLLEKIQNAVTLLSDIERFLQAQTITTAYKLEMPKQPIGIEYEFSLVFFMLYPSIRKFNFCKLYMKERCVTRQAAAIAFETLISRGYVERDNKPQMYCLTHKGNKKLKEIMDTAFDTPTNTTSQQIYAS